ncbi:pectate lyase superfamily domain-containing protein, partial [Trichoderma velutinum]
FGAVGDGETDDTAAINRAISYYSKSDNSIRCGQDCGSTTTLGALVYFPPGIYSVSTPLVMYYYTQMVGDPNSKPTIKGAFNFSGIALVDSDLYIPGGNGAEWYINQSNFYRQIRNFVFDMTSMNWTNIEGDQQYVPTGVHWQVGQATSITNCDFNMAVSIAGQSATAVGIFMENGSGGFVSDLTFTGGNIGFRAGSQQFTANNLQFTSCLTAISMIWNWGFTWKNVYVLSCYIALDLTAYSGTDGQGTGSVSVVDSHFNGVPYAITLSGHDPEPDIILDNLLVENSASVVLVSGGETILPGSTGALYFNSWGMGPQYLSFDGSGSRKTGFINPAPNKPTSLLDSSTGRYFTRSKPQYENSSPIIATAHGISNNGTGDQTAAINSLLSSNIGSVVFFPAGIYLAEGTIKVPVGSIITGSGWSQIVAVGAYFYNQTSPKVLVQVGNEGDSGIVEISDMLFTVKGPTAGCILMEWNVHESTQGSSGMWDSHFRVGGAVGSDLQLADCPTGATSANTKCMAASMMLHVTKSASGYFENIWAWVADHDLDDPANADATESNDGIPENVKTDISVYGARGILVESNGPTWFYGTASEHSVLYQYQCSNASNIFFGHMQTETPYYQPNPTALDPYTIGGSQWESDPTFADCADDDCKTAWSLRLINSKNIFIYSAGFYSFFQNNQLGCASTETCQLRMIDTNFVSGLWLYNIFTKGNIQIISPEGGPSYVLFNDTTKNGYTSEIAAWLVLSTSGSDLGNNGSLVGGESDGSGFVFLDPTIWSQQKPTVQCSPPCTLILPPVTLSTTTTITFPLYTTSLEVGWTTTTAYVTSDVTASVKESVAVGVISYLNSLGDMSGIGSPTTKQTSTSSSPSVPSNTAELCVGLMTTPSTEEPIYNYVTFNAGDPCDGVFILNATIGTPENICDIPNKQATVDLCAGTGTFENEGPQFFSNPSCGFALSLNGHTYETAQTGILLFSELPGCD